MQAVSEFLSYIGPQEACEFLAKTCNPSLIENYLSCCSKEYKKEIIENCTSEDATKIFTNCTLKTSLDILIDIEKDKQAEILHLLPTELNKKLQDEIEQITTRAAKNSEVPSKEPRLSSKVASSVHKALQGLNLFQTVIGKFLPSFMNVAIPQIGKNKDTKKSR